ncbi:hypothetical protein BH23GEM3_BH23GEM3_22220 [soil metagenome]
MISQMYSFTCRAVTLEGFPVPSDREPPHLLVVGCGALQVLVETRLSVGSASANW